MRIRNNHAQILPQDFQQCFMRPVMYSSNLQGTQGRAHGNVEKVRASTVITTKISEDTLSVKTQLFTLIKAPNSIEEGNEFFFQFAVNSAMIAVPFSK
jgi:hypothetical protein